MLRVVTADPWARQADESPEEFALFCVWLLATPRGAPDRDLSNLAVDRKWAERATAYDAFISRPSNPRDQIAAVQANLLATVDAEAAKLLKLSRQSPTMVISPKDLITLASYVTETRSFLAGIMSEESDLSDLSTEDLEAMLAIQQRVSKGRR